MQEKGVLYERAQLRSGKGRTMRRLQLSTKHPDSYKQQREMRRRAYASTRSLREESPQVEELVLHLTFRDPNGIAHHSPQTHSFAPGAKAFFTIACPSSSCLAGGFDLADVVARVLAGGGSDASGLLDCPGWQSSGRDHKDRCLLEMRYRLTVRYRDD
jgi:hypothetical protein